MTAIALKPEYGKLPTISLLCWRVPPAPEPNYELLKNLRRRRRGQSKDSHRRHQFITGMTRIQTTPQELRNRRLYIEEYHLRLQDNEGFLI